MKKKDIFWTREYMDRIKYEVKMSKTTEKIEKYAVLYEEAVEEFDAQARRTIILLNLLPSIKGVHAVSFGAEKLVTWALFATETLSFS